MLVRPKGKRWGFLIVSAYSPQTSLENKTITQRTMSDEEPVDPLIAIREGCGETKSCAFAMSEYKACIERIEKKGFGTCEPWFFDYLSCIDKCAAPKIMKVLK